MSPITHFLAGWVLFERQQTAWRDKGLVVAAGLVPDLDGAGIVVDFATRLLGLPETDFYQASHRMFGHGLAAAIVIALVVMALAERKAVAAGYAFVNVHLHFLCDILGSRGTTVEDLWGIYYGAPFSTAGQWVWSGQWPLVGWQNFLLTALLLALTLQRAQRVGYSPLHLVSATGDVVLVTTLRDWRRRCAGALRFGR